MSNSNNHLHFLLVCHHLSFLFPNENWVWLILLFVNAGNKSSDDVAELFFPFRCYCARKEVRSRFTFFLLSNTYYSFDSLVIGPLPWHDGGRHECGKRYTWLRAKECRGNSSTRCIQDDSFKVIREMLSPTLDKTWAYPYTLLSFVEGSKNRIFQAPSWKRHLVSVQYIQSLKEKSLPWNHQPRHFRVPLCGSMYKVKQTIWMVYITPFSLTCSKISFANHIDKMASCPSWKETTTYNATNTWWDRDQVCWLPICNMFHSCP